MTQFTPPTAGMLGGFDMRGALTGILSGDSELAREHQQEQAMHLPSPGSASYNALSPEQQEAIDRERERRERVAREQRAAYIESVGGYGNYEGGFNDADYWNAGNPTMEGAFYYGGQIYDGTSDPTSGFDYSKGSGLGAGHWQGGNTDDSTGGGAGGNTGGGGTGGGGTGGGTSGGNGGNFPESNVSSSTPFLDSYMRTREAAKAPGPVSQTMSDYL